jgi:CO/xanthine dehydrogenase Mo-binding subunit
VTTRRRFLQGAGAIVLYFNTLPSVLAQQATETDLPGSLAANPGLGTWLRVDADGSVTLSPGKCELGQGIQTALAQIAAEELDVSFERVSVATVDTAVSPNEAYTNGSRSVEVSGAAVRAAAAEVRAILIDLAAEELGVGSAKIGVRNGVFMVAGKPSTLDFGAVVKNLNLARNATGTVSPKPRDRYQIVGHSLQRIDIPRKAYAEAAYIQDIRLDGMLHARVVRTGDREAKLLPPANFDAVSELPGVVKIVRNGSFLAVVAEREEQAVNAANALASLCRWQGAELPFQEGRISAWLKKAPADVKVVAERGAIGAGNILRTVSQEYSRPFQAHASMSPSMAIAQEADGQLTVWSHTQGVFMLRGAIARLVGLDEDSVRLINAEAAGCYGHNGADDAAADAALIAMQMPGKAIRLQWSRADEFLGEPYGSAMTTRISAGLDDAGRIVDWQFDVWSGTHSIRPAGAKRAAHLFAARQIAVPLPLAPVGNIPQPRGGGDRNAVPLYAFANQRITKHLIRDMPLRVSAMRALGAYTNVFAIESFMDELAQAQGEDPFDFRIRYLHDQRAIGVLGRLREQMAAAGFDSVQAPGGVGIAMAQYKNSGAYCAVAMRVKVDTASGDIKLEHALCAVDIGLVVNPDGAINQIEGGVIQSASWTVREQLRLTPGGVASKDWAGYPILTFPEVPKVEVVLIDQPDEPSLGAGEASQGPTAAAIANAVANATAVRVRDLPLTPARVKSA